MSSLTFSEQRKLEKLFGMSSGYVCDFSDSSFGDFFVDAVKINIHDIKYQSSGTSKAKKLREFWRIEDDFNVGQSIIALTQYVSESMPESENNLIEQCKQIAERLLSGKTNLNYLKGLSTEFSAKYLAEQIKRIEDSVNSDPALAIGTAKELVETCCKTILSERGKSVSNASDIATLTKEVLKELKLVPDGIDQSVRGADVIKRLLQNLGTIGNGLAELRGLYGTGHGKHAASIGLTPRHAKLAVGAASTLTAFLFETHKEIAN